MRNRHQARTALAAVLILVLLYSIHRLHTRHSDYFFSSSSSEPRLTQSFDEDSTVVPSERENGISYEAQMIQPQQQQQHRVQQDKSSSYGRGKPLHRAILESLRLTRKKGGDEEGARHDGKDLHEWLNGEEYPVSYPAAQAALPFSGNQHALGDLVDTRTVHRPTKVVVSPSSSLPSTSSSSSSSTGAAVNRAFNRKPQNAKDPLATPGFLNAWHRNATAPSATPNDEPSPTSSPLPTASTTADNEEDEEDEVEEEVEEEEEEEEEEEDDDDDDDDVEFEDESEPAVESLSRSAVNWGGKSQDDAGAQPYKEVTTPRQEAGERKELVRVVDANGAQMGAMKHHPAAAAPLAAPLAPPLQQTKSREGHEGKTSRSARAKGQVMQWGAGVGEEEEERSGARHDKKMHALQEMRG